jgi:hypothetical protein
MARLLGVHATVADIRDGVAITFTGPAGELEQLRANVHAMAEANDKKKDAFAACPCAQRAALGSAEKMPAEKGAATALPSTRPVALLATAKVDETATGAILKLTAKDKADVAALRNTVREDVHTLRKSCLNQGAGEAAPTEKQGVEKHGTRP